MIFLDVHGRPMVLLQVELQIVESFQLDVAEVTWIRVHSVLLLVVELHEVKPLVAFAAEATAEPLDVRVDVRVLREQKLRRKPLVAVLALESLLFGGRMDDRDVRRQVVFDFERRRTHVAGERSLLVAPMRHHVNVELLLA